MDDKLLTTRAAADILGLSPGTLYNRLCNGSWPFQPVRIGGRLRWRESDLVAFIAGGGETARSRRANGRQGATAE